MHRQRHHYDRRCILSPNKDKIDSMLHGMLKDRSEECIIQSCIHLAFLRRKIFCNIHATSLYQSGSWSDLLVFQKDHPKFVCGTRLFLPYHDLLFRVLNAKVDSLDAELGEYGCEEMFGAAVNRFAAQEDISRLQQFEHRCADCCIPLSNTAQASASSHIVSRSSRISKSGLLIRL